MNLLIHDVAAAIERDASQESPSADRYKVTEAPSSYDVARSVGHRWTPTGSGTDPESVADARIDAP